MTELVIFLGVVFAFSLVSRRIEGSMISAPMIFVGAGMLLGPGVLGWSRATFEGHTVLAVGEIALALLLFTDAVGVRPGGMGARPRLISRLLGIGMPLTILLGFLAARVLLPGLTLAEAGILATVLAPTDAALGKPVVSNPRVPRRVRDSLNVEAGLNDGLSVPFLMLFLALAEAEQLARPGAYFLTVALEQIGFGALAGLGVGLIGGALIRAASAKEWASHAAVGPGMLALALVAYAAAVALGGNGFIAAFTAGFGARVTGREAASHAIEFAEHEGQILNYLVFFVFGIISLSILERLTGPILLYAVMSLTVIRMGPVAISLLGARLRPSSILFMGWFGPRGLASIVLALIVAAEAPGLPDRPVIGAAAVATILLSVVLHGISAAPLSGRYSREVAKLPVGAPERAG